MGPRQRQWQGKGKGKQGKGKGWGKGKGKEVDGIDDQDWGQQDLTQQQAWAQQPEWPPNAAAFAAAPSPMPWMDAAQASASASDPWASWPSTGAWQPSVNSLAPKPRQISSLAMASPKPPVTTHNTFNALAENIGSDGQKSKIGMPFGQIAKIELRRPRRAKLSTSSISAAADPN